MITRPITRSITRPITRPITGGEFSGDVQFFGGNVRDGEFFTIFLRDGGLTGTTTCTLNGIACTSYTVIDDNNSTAIAPTNDLLHGIAYDLVIA